MQRGPQQVSFEVYISHIKKTFDGVVAAALKSLETVGKGGGNVQGAVKELGGKIEEFEAVCDEIYSLIAYTHTIVLERETQRELERQLGTQSRPIGPSSIATTPASSTPSSSSPSSNPSRSSPLQKKTPPTPSSSTSNVEKEKEGKEKEEIRSPTAMQIDNEEEGKAATPSTPASGATSAASPAPTAAPAGRTIEARLQLIKQLEKQLDSAKRIREELLSFTQEVSLFLPPVPSSSSYITASPSLLAVGESGADDYDLLFTAGGS